MNETIFEIKQNYGRIADGIDREFWTFCEIPILKSKFSPWGWTKMLEKVPNGGRKGPMDERTLALN